MPETVANKVLDLQTAQLFNMKKTHYRSRATNMSLPCNQHVAPVQTGAQKKSALDARLRGHDRFHRLGWR